MGILSQQILAVSVVVLMFDTCCSGHEAHYSLSGSCNHKHLIHDDHNHDEDHHTHHHSHHQHHGHDLHQNEGGLSGWKLPEELAEEEDLKLYGIGIHHGRDHHDDDWDLDYEGEIYGVGGENSNSHDHDGQHVHYHLHNETVHSHSHSLKDLSDRLSFLAGIVLFLLVEKAVRYVEGASRGANAWGHNHHHHHHKKDKMLKDDHGNMQLQSLNTTENESTSQMSSKEKIIDKVSGESLTLDGGRETPDEPHLQKRNVNAGLNDKHGLDAVNGSTDDSKSPFEKEPAHSSSNLVFGYLNLFSDGVHNFADGMALGTAFLLYGSLGSWSRTLFLLAHELSQEVGDFGILVRSGFSVSKAVFFSFLSALVALAGTALRFTAGGFIYVAVAGVFAEMNNGNPT